MCPHMYPLVINTNEMHIGEEFWFEKNVHPSLVYNTSHSVRYFSILAQAAEQGPQPFSTVCC